MNADCPFPHCVAPEYNPCDGYLFPLPTVYRHEGASSLVRFYEEMPADAVIRDTFGYSCYKPAAIPGLVFVGMRVDGRHDPRHAPGPGSRFFSPLVELPQIERTVHALQRMRAWAAETREPATPGSEHVEQLIHELRSLNAQLKAAATEVTKQLPEAQPESFRLFLQKRAAAIYEVSTMLTMRVDFYRFQSAPDRTIKQCGKRQLSIYKCFQSISGSLKPMCQDRGVSIRLDGTSRTISEVIDCFDHVPLVLLENAVKYAPKSSVVTVSFNDDAEGTTVLIRSMGPQVMPDEANQIWERGYRGRNASGLAPGSGLGLPFARLLCQLSSCQISAKSLASPVYSLSGVPMAPFEVRLRLPVSRLA